LKRLIFTPILALLVFFDCHAQQQSAAAQLSDSATSTQLFPGKPAGYYADQGVKYFRTMESSVSRKVKPDYAKLVIRYEWHPWLLLTGYKRANLINSDNLLKLYKTKYDTIDCKAFNKEPFCRCHVVFNYDGTRIPIYEEFTFNPQGEITFIEAWSDYPSLIPMHPNDYWALADSVNRLSTRIPGLGNATGCIKPNAAFTKRAASHDPLLADLLNRLKHPITTYVKELIKQRKQIAGANHPPVGDKYPYWP